MVGLTACNLFSGDGASSDQWLSNVRRGDISVTVSGSGNIQVARDINLAFGTSGKIDKIYVEEGDMVKNGDFLAKMETDSLELAFSQAELNISQAELAISQAELSELQAGVALSQAQTTETQAKVALESAIFDRDRMKDVRDIQDDIERVKAEIKAAEAQMKVAIQSKSPDVDVRYWSNTITGLKLELFNYQQDLADLLDEDKYASLGAATISSLQAYTELDQVKIKELQVQAAQDSVAQAKKAVEQASKNLEQAAESVEFNKKSLEVAQQSVKQAQKNLDEATITAPFDGLVAAVNADEGDVIPTPTVSPKTIIYLIDPSSMELQVDVDEIDIPQVEIGQKAIVTLDAFPDNPFEGKVTFISLVPTPQSGVVLFNVKIGFQPPKDSGIRVDMSADADIILKERTNVLLIPSQAIYHNSQGNTVVSIMKGDRTEERAVVTGVDDGFDVEVISGLSEGETVVVSAKTS